jgi:hypothetical protein
MIDRMRFHFERLMLRGLLPDESRGPELTVELLEGENRFLFDHRVELKPARDAEWKLVPDDKVVVLATFEK